MGEDRFQLVQRIFEEGLRCDPSSRATYLDEACGRDAELRGEVEALLRHHTEAAEGFMERAAEWAVTGTVSLDLGKRFGQLIGRYKVVSVLGEGGFAIVYLAEQTEPVRRRVALKIIKAGMDTKQVSARFEAERQALAMMDHPNVAKVFDAGVTPAEAGSRPYFVMEHVPGIPITEHCDRQRLSIEQRLALFTQVCDAVQHAHQKGIIHRDIKPSNVLVSVREGSAVPKVIDFGVAKALHQKLTEKTLFTEQGQLIGTPEYMSPEQAEMTAQDIDTRSDIYSLGVLLYELLTGALPFDPKSLRQAAFAEIQRIIREEEPPKPSTKLSSLDDASTTNADNRRLDPRSLMRELRGDLDWIVMKALEKDRQRRYETANGFASDIRRHLGHEPVVAAPPSARYRFQKFARRNKRLLGSVTVIAAALIIGLTLAIYGSITASSERDLRREIADQLSRAQFQYANTLYLDGDYESAERIYRMVLPSRRAAYGDESLEVAQVLDFLGSCLTSSGEFVEAEERHRQALAIRRRLATTDNARAELTQSLNNLGRCLQDQGKFAEAEPLLDECVTIFRSLEMDIKLPFFFARVLDKLARSLASVGEYTKAEERFREALVLKETTYGDEHWSVATTRHGLAQLKFDQGDYEQAERWCRDALDLRQRVRRPGHPDVADSLQLLGEILIARDDLVGAEERLRRALEMSESETPVVGSRVAETQSVLGGCLAAEGRHEEAEPLLVDSLPIIRKRWGEQQKHTLAALDRIISLYKAWGKPDKAAEWRAKLEEFEHLGTDEEKGPSDV